MAATIITRQGVTNNIFVFDADESKWVLVSEGKK